MAAGADSEDKVAVGMVAGVVSKVEAVKTWATETVVMALTGASWATAGMTTRSAVVMVSPARGREEGG
jgi:hypothetical protein